MTLNQNRSINDHFHNNVYIFTHVFISWLIFSIFYIIAAYFKPFHVDEFYSWVYVERSTFIEILRLKSFGIGHPPLYHLLQKLVQTYCVPYHPIYVRLVNYIIGSLFIVIFTRMILKQKKVPLFCYGIAGSAAVLEIFIFSRMFGLVCLSSLLLLWSGEKYCENPKPKNLLIFIGICILGFISDYSFILLSMYFIIVLFWRIPFLKKFSPVFLVFIFILSVLTIYRKSDIQHTGIAHLFYVLFRDLFQVISKTWNVLFNFWFIEPLLIASLIFMVLMILEIFNQSHRKDINIIGPVKYLFILVSFLKDKIKNIFNVNRDYIRFLLTFLGAWLIILAVNQFFWTGIIRKRFLTIFCPYLIYLIFTYCNKRTLNILTIIFLCSGVIYISSNRVAGVYPPPSFNDKIPIIYQNEWAYTTQYLSKHREPPENPFIFDFTSFNERCILCKMGTNDIPFDSLDSFLVIWNNDSDPQNYIPPEFSMIEQGKPNFTWMDHIEFKYLTPLPKTTYLRYKFKRIQNN